MRTLEKLDHLLRFKKQYKLLRIEYTKASGVISSVSVWSLKVLTTKTRIILIHIKDVQIDLTKDLTN